MNWLSVMKYLFHRRRQWICFYSYAHNTVLLLPECDTKLDLSTGGHLHEKHSGVHLWRRFYSPFGRIWYHLRFLVGSCGSIFVFWLYVCVGSCYLYFCVVFCCCCSFVSLVSLYLTNKFECHFDVIRFTLFYQEQTRPRKTNVYKWKDRLKFKNVKIDEKKLKKCKHHRSSTVHKQFL